MMEDAAELCERRNSPVFTDFLTEAEQAAAAAVMRRVGANYLLYGGYEDAERRMLGVFPPYDEPDGSLFPIDSITAVCRASEKLAALTHLPSMEKYPYSPSFSTTIIPSL